MYILEFISKAIFMSNGMVFDIYKISSPELSRYIQYILFNYCSEPSHSQFITSFANTNICLGIVKEKELCCRPDGVKCMRYKPGINAYLSGMYLRPHRFEAAGLLDEICIDFTPVGYYRFFRFPAKMYILNEDVLTEGFGKDAKIFFETVFEVADFQERGALIEDFLRRMLIDAHTTFLEECLYFIHRSYGTITLKDLAARLQCSEKKIVRAFLYSFDLTPKDYMRIVRFRKALCGMNGNHTGSLTSIGYESDYFDQSHFIKDFRFFTGKTPKQIMDTIVDVHQNVIIGVE